jgi:hypothetical protein
MYPAAVCRPLSPGRSAARPATVRRPPRPSAPNAEPRSRPRPVPGHGASIARSCRIASASIARAMRRSGGARRWGRAPGLPLRTSLIDPSRRTSSCCPAPLRPPRDPRTSTTRRPDSTTGPFHRLPRLRQSFRLPRIGRLPASSSSPPPRSRPPWHRPSSHPGWLPRLPLRHPSRSRHLRRTSTSPRSSHTTRQSHTTTATLRRTTTGGGADRAPA